MHKVGFGALRPSLPCGRVDAGPHHASVRGAPVIDRTGTSSERADAADPLESQAVDIARKHVSKRAGTYGLSSADVVGPRVSSVVPSESNGLTHVYLQQRVNSIEVSTAMLNVAVTAKGKVLRVASSAVASAGKKANGATPKISDVQAAQRAAAALGLEPSGSFASNDDPEGAGAGPDPAEGGDLAGPDHRAAGLPGDEEG